MFFQPTDLIEQEACQCNDDMVLRDLVKEPLSVKDIVALTGRSVDCVIGRLVEMGTRPVRNNA